MFLKFRNSLNQFVNFPFNSLLDFTKVKNIKNANTKDIKTIIMEPFRFGVKLKLLELFSYPIDVV